MGSTEQHEAFLLGRVLLDFDRADVDLWSELSAIALTPDGSLWVGSDELQTLERLRPLSPMHYGEHHSCPLPDNLTLPDPEGEIDFEGLDYGDGFLWFVGSHSQKRKRPKGKPSKDLKRLTQVVREPNRYALGRISISDKGDLNAKGSAMLAMGDADNDWKGNPLMTALGKDPHLGDYIHHPIPSKENGLDIEGLAVRGDRLFIGLRGPVLRGYGIVLELRYDPSEKKDLVLLPAAGKHLYRKHIFNLRGEGIRDLCWDGDDLLLLAGPTMAVDGYADVVRWRSPLEDVDSETPDIIYEPDGKQLQPVMTLPTTRGYDYAEGIMLAPCWEEPALWVVHDGPGPQRLIGDRSLLIDVFRLP
ncbi:MAG: DUF3616 domain-containing protein [Cyanobacteria bacterium P01_H01_bin.130]